MSETEAAELSVTIFAAMNVLVGAEAQLYAAVAVAQTNAKPESTPEPELERVTTALFHATRVAHAACEAALTRVEPMYDADLRLRLHETEEYAGCKTEVASALENASTIATALEYASTQYAGWMSRSISYDSLCDDDAMSEAIHGDNIGHVALGIVLLLESQSTASTRNYFFSVLRKAQPNLRVLRMLLSSPAHTANIRKGEFFSNTVLMVAASLGHAEAVSALLACPTVVESVVFGTHRNTALMCASEVKTIHALLACSQVAASASAVDEGGYTVLMLATIRRQHAAVTALLAYPEITRLAGVKCCKGYTALMIACELGNTETVIALLKCSAVAATASVVNRNGFTALMLAIRGHAVSSTIAVLLACPEITQSAGAVNVHGNTALMIALSHPMTDAETIIALLACPAIAASAGATNNYGETAVTIARSEHMHRSASIIALVESALG
jgi:hypothetical protein